MTKLLQVLQVLSIFFLGACTTIVYRVAPDANTSDADTPMDAYVLDADTSDADTPMDGATTDPDADVADAATDGSDIVDAGMPDVVILADGAVVTDCLPMVSDPEVHSLDNPDRPASVGSPSVAATELSGVCVRNRSLDFELVVTMQLATDPRSTWNVTFTIELINFVVHQECTESFTRIGYILDAPPDTVCAHGAYMRGRAIQESPYGDQGIPFSPVIVSTTETPAGTQLLTVRLPLYERYVDVSMEVL